MELVIVEPVESARLNLKLRGLRGVADILSFPGPDAGSPGPAGSVALCPPAIRSRARRLGLAPARWAARLAVHGVLHALGFHHDRPADGALMESLTDALLAGRSSR